MTTATIFRVPKARNPKHPESKHVARMFLQSIPITKDRNSAHSTDLLYSDYSRYVMDQWSKNWNKYPNHTCMSQGAFTALVKEAYGVMVKRGKYQGLLVHERPGWWIN